VGLQAGNTVINIAYALRLDPAAPTAEIPESGVKEFDPPSPPDAPEYSRVYGSTGDDAARCAGELTPEERKREWERRFEARLNCFGYVSESEIVANAT